MNGGESFEDNRLKTMADHAVRPMNSISQPVHFAAHMGRDVGNFVLGEMGLHHDNLGSDPSQVEVTTPHRVTSNDSLHKVGMICLPGITH